MEEATVMTEDPKQKACPVCGRTGLTWLADGSRPRSHKCEPQAQTQTSATEPVQEGGITADRVIDAFIKTRDEIAVLKKQFEADVADMKLLQEKRGNWLKTQMDKLGVKGLKGVHGSVSIDWKDSAKVADPAIFLSWVFEDTEGRKHFLENRVSKTAVKQYLEDEDLVGLPPGVDYTKFKDVKVRRS